MVLYGVKGIGRLQNCVGGDHEGRNLTHGCLAPRPSVTTQTLGPSITWCIATDTDMTIQHWGEAKLWRHDDVLRCGIGPSCSYFGTAAFGSYSVVIVIQTLGDLIIVPAIVCHEGSLKA